MKGAQEEAPQPGRERIRGWRFWHLFRTPSNRVQVPICPHPSSAKQNSYKLQFGFSRIRPHPSTSLGQFAGQHHVTWDLGGRNVPFFYCNRWTTTRDAEPIGWVLSHFGHVKNMPIHLFLIPWICSISRSTYVDQFIVRAWRLKLTTLIIESRECRLNLAINLVTPNTTCSRKAGPSSLCNFF
jgi:hypothetical protein